LIKRDLIGLVFYLLIRKGVRHVERSRNIFIQIIIAIANAILFYRKEYPNGYGYNSPHCRLISVSFDLSQHKVFGLRFLETLFVFSKTQKRFVEYIIKYTSAFSLSFVLHSERSRRISFIVEDVVHD